jgi:SecD/SecF fusion protein
MKQNLGSRFILILAAIVLAALCIYFNGIRGGIDLSGGTSLVYQLNVPKNYHGSTSRLAQQVIAVLRKRVDPDNVYNLVWRVLTGDRIEIQMPLSSAKSRAAQKQYQTLVHQLESKNIQPSQIHAALAASGAQRQKEFMALAAGDKNRLALLQKLAAANAAFNHVEKLTAAYKNPLDVPTRLVQQLQAATKARSKALNAVLALNVNVQNLAGLFSSDYTHPTPAIQKDIAAIIAAHPHRAGLIKKLQAAYVFLQKHSGGLNNPAELERLLRGSGVLDFRITYPMTNASIQALAQLKKRGPNRGFTPAGTAWYPIDARDGQDLIKMRGAPDYTIGRYEGKYYILLYTTPQKALSHGDGRQHWKVSRAELTTDPNSGEPVVDFTLDNAGGAYMGELTSHNIGQQMAILLDGKAITAPTIQSTIHSNGMITLGGPSASQSVASIEKQGEILVQTLNAGSLPATLQSQPISVYTIGATLGADNLRAGLHSAIIAVIVVLLFMFTYYTITGAFADIALLLNLLLTLGVMALIHATFTLPGIAGVVLTLGMAVDANILINERIREELRKGASLWLAVKQGYDRVFWTIFDANLTTSLTSMVLIAVGSEDVKGFGVTLLIGLAVHMFTALFVTRTLMIAAIRFGVMKQIDDLSVKEYFRDLFTFTWLKGRWPFMRVFTLANFDWIGKRYIFWVVSGCLIVGGIITFIARGNKKYDTEFNGGTQITLQLKPGVTMPVSQVRRRVEAIGRKIPALKALQHATVYSLGSRHNQFQIITSIVNPPGKSGIKPGASSNTPVGQLSHALEVAFAKQIKVTRRLAFTDVGVSAKHISALINHGIVMPITHNSLAEIAPGLPNVDVSDYRGGVAILLQNISPAESVHSMTERITSMSEEPDFANIEYRPFKVIPLHYATGSAAGRGASRRPAVTSAVVVAVDPNLPYDANSEAAIQAWSKKVAAPEWRIVRTALTTSGGLAGITSFAPQVAAEARLNAVASVLISLILIVIYVWLRFGGIRYGFGVIFSLVHDAVVAVAATVLAVFIHETAIGKFLLVDNFKINMTMIAAYLTIIGYSVNDTIVIFDRVRENRGRTKQPLTAKLVNDSINQCFGRTVWTTFTVFVVVLILYIFGGAGVHGFAYAMLIGVFTGAYSTLAIASPMLLHVKDKPAKPNKALTGGDGQSLAAQTAAPQ